MVIKCKICLKEVRGFHGLSGHVNKLHSLSSKEYYDKYIKLPKEGVCYLKECNNKTNYKRTILESGGKNMSKDKRTVEDLLTEWEDEVNEEHLTEAKKSVVWVYPAGVVEAGVFIDVHVYYEPQPFKDLSSASHNAQSTITKYGQEVLKALKKQGDEVFSYSGQAAEEVEGAGKDIKIRYMFHIVNKNIDIKDKKAHLDFAEDVAGIVNQKYKGMTIKFAEDRSKVK